MNQDILKQACAEAALQYVKDDMIVGVGTGSTTNYFIDALASIKNKIEGTVASSLATEKRLKARGIPVFDLNTSNQVALYIDGTDEINPNHYLIKGGGGAHTREKILAAAAQKFICIADHTKQVDRLGSKMPIPLEVIPMARSYVGRQIVKLGGDPCYREHFVTDNGNIVIDIHNLAPFEPLALEQQLNNIPGVIENGIFAECTPDISLIASTQGVKTIQRL